jgi:YHS domain-containing protein
MKSILAALMLVGGVLAGCSSHDDRDHRTTYRDPDTHRDYDRDHRTTYHDQDAYRDHDRDRHHDRDLDTPSSRTSERENWNTTQSDMVCGHTVNPKTTPWREYFDGKVYYFDTEDCWRRFHDNPQAYFPRETPRTDVR